MHRTFYGLLERGRHGFTIVHVPDIARALGVRQAELPPRVVDEAIAQRAHAALPSRPACEGLSGPQN
jgi:hypothetical protein